MILSGNLVGFNLQMVNRTQPVIKLLIIECSHIKTETQNIVEHKNIAHS